MSEYGFDETMSLQQLSDALKKSQLCDWCEERKGINTVYRNNGTYYRCDECGEPEPEGMGDQEYNERQYHRYGPDGGV